MKNDVFREVFCDLKKDSGDLSTCYSILNKTHSHSSYFFVSELN